MCREVEMSDSILMTKKTLLRIIKNISHKLNRDINSGLAHKQKLNLHNVIVENIKIVENYLIEMTKLDAQGICYLTQNIRDRIAKFDGVFYSNISNLKELLALVKDIKSLLEGELKNEILGDNVTKGDVLVPLVDLIESLRLLNDRLIVADNVALSSKETYLLSSTLFTYFYNLGIGNYKSMMTADDQLLNHAVKDIHDLVKDLREKNIIDATLLREIQNNLYKLEINIINKDPNYLKLKKADEGISGKKDDLKSINNKVRSIDNKFKNVHESMNTSLDNMYGEIAGLKDNFRESVMRIEKSGKDEKNKFEDIAFKTSKLLNESESLKKIYEQTVDIETSKKLQKKFEERAGKVEEDKGVWSDRVFWACIVAGIVTFIVLLNPWGMIEFNTGNLDPWMGFILRSVIAILSFTILGFTIAQYNKEREIEEAYRFKETIAFSLPNFREIATDDELKNRLLEESVHVLYNPPYESGKKLKAESKKKTDDLSDVLDLLTKAQNLVKDSPDDKKN
jgi:hypothetical protein